MGVHHRKKRLRYFTPDTNCNQKWCQRRLKGRMERLVWKSLIMWIQTSHINNTVLNKAWVKWPENGMLENFYQTKRGQLSESSVLHSVNIFISFLHLRSSPIFWSFCTVTFLSVYQCAFDFPIFSNSFVSTNILPLPSSLSLYMSITMPHT